MSRVSADFEEIYAGAGVDLEAVPWAHLAPNTALVEFLDGLPSGTGEALVVGCGLGDDAEELARRGYEVTAFDVAPTAIARCRERFPESTVEYEIADVLDLPAIWSGRFDLVIEIRTLQCLPQNERSTGARQIAATVATGGRLYVRCFRLADDNPDRSAGPPWPLDRADLAVLEDAGLTNDLLLENDVGRPGADRGPTFTAVYSRR